VAAARDLEPLARLAGRLLAVAVPTGLSALMLLALVAEQPQAVEGVAVVGQSLLAQLDLGEANHRMRPLPCGQARPSSPARATN
jgi:hypothetical protein